MTLNGNGNGLSAGRTAMQSASSYASAPSLSQPRGVDKEALAAWVLDKSDPRHKSVQCSSFVLVHMSHEHGATVITPIPFAKKTPADDRPALAARIAAEFALAAQRWADMYPSGPSSFVVAAHLQEDASASAYCQYPVGAVTPSPGLAGGFERGIDEGPSLPGVVANYQRLFESMLSKYASNMQSDKDRYIDEIAEKNRHLERLLAQSLELHKELEESRNEQARRDVEVREKMMSIEVMGKLQMAALTYGKAYMDRHMEAKFGKAGENPVLELLKSFEPEQLVDVMKTLKPEQKETFLQMCGPLIESMPEEKKVRVMMLVTARAEEEAKEIAEREKVRVVKEEPNR
jgi:hypothetical protein